MIDYANTLLLPIQCVPCAACTTAGQTCARYTANPLSNCVLGLSLGHTRTTAASFAGTECTMQDGGLKARFAIPVPPVRFRAELYPSCNRDSSV